LITQPFGGVKDMKLAELRAACRLKDGSEFVFYVRFVFHNE